MRNPKIAARGVIGSAALLLVFLLIQAADGSPMLGLRLRWLFVAATPAVIGLVAGGYVPSFGAKKAEPFGPEIEGLPEASRAGGPREKDPTEAWLQERASEYARTDSYELVHTYRPASEPGEGYDVFIYLVRHRKGSSNLPRRHHDEVRQAEFFFGEGWGNEVFRVSNRAGLVGVRTQARGSFLATSRVSFTEADREPVILHRYIDFEMSPAPTTEPPASRHRSRGSRSRRRA